MPRLSRVINIAGLIFLSSIAAMVLLNLGRRNVYDSRLGINLLVVAKDGLGIVAIRPSAGLVSLTRLPDNLVVPVDSSEASYQVEAFYKVGLPTGDELRVSRVSVGQALGVVISGVLKSGEELNVNRLPNQISSLATRSDLSLIDRYRIFKDVSGILSKKTSLEVALPKSTTDVFVEADGKGVLKLNSSIFVWSNNQWVVDEVLSETAEVVIVNATGVTGAARLVAHQLESAGIRVIDLVGARKEADACLVWGERRKHPMTFDYLVTSFGCQVWEGDIFEYVDRGVRSDLVLILPKKN